jgi:hypothetical protein
MGINQIRLYGIFVKSYRTKKPAARAGFKAWREKSDPGGTCVCDHLPCVARALPYCHPGLHVFLFPSYQCLLATPAKKGHQKGTEQVAPNCFQLLLLSKILFVPIYVKKSYRLKYRPFLDLLPSQRVIIFGIFLSDFSAPNRVF